MSVNTTSLGCTSNNSVAILYLAENSLAEGVLAEGSLADGTLYAELMVVLGSAD